MTTSWKVPVRSFFLLLFSLFFLTYVYLFFAPSTSHEENLDLQSNIKQGEALAPLISHTEKPRKNEVKTDPEDSIIKPGVPWYDTDGNKIHAHGGGFYFDKVEKKYYWFGESEKLHYQDWLSEGINCYSSYNLVNWTFEGMVFRNTSIKNVKESGPYRIERPKVLFNQQTKKFVLWFHLDTVAFRLQSVGVAVSNRINGNYEWVAGFQPDGMQSFDMTLFQDTDGSGYLCRSVANQFTGISKLTSNYLNTTGITSSGPTLEAHALWKMQNNYYMIASQLSGWSPNPASLLVSQSKKLDRATWEFLGNPTGSETTFNSQSTFVLTHERPNGNHLYIFMGDRWNYPNLDQASYIWLPIIVKSPMYLSVKWYNEWRIGDF